MNRRLLLLLLLLGSWLGLGTAQAQTTLAQESFESATNPANSASSFGYTSFAQNYFDDRANTVQFFQRSSLPVSGFNTANGFVFGTGIDGSWLVAGEAVRGQTGGAPDRDARFVQLNGVSIAGKTGIQVKVSFADARGLGSGATIGQGTNNWENNDFVRIKARVNGGAWTVIGQLTGDNAAGGGGGRLRQDTNLNGISSDDLSAPAVGSSFQDFTFGLTGSGSTLDVMVEVDAIGGSEELALDNVRVLGTASATAAPVLANIETTSLSYNEGDPATIITSAVTVSDADSPNLSGGSVTLTTGFVSAQDRLLFTNQNGISGAYNTGTGVLTLSGTASLAAYQAALRSVRYQNIETVTAIGGLRLATFTVTDGTATSAVSRNIVVNAQLNAPAALPYTEEFETNGEGLRYASNTWSTSNPCLGFLRTNANPYSCTPTTFGGISGSYYWYAEGTKNGANPNPVRIGTLVLAPVNATNIGSLHFNVKLGIGEGTPAGLQWEIDDYVKFFYRVNGGAWVLFGAYVGDGPTTASSGNLRRDADLNGVADANGTILTTTLQNTDFALPTSITGASVDFMMEVSSDGQEELATDRIVVTGTALVAPTVTTGTAGSLTASTAAISNNSLTNDGGANLSDYGVVYVAGTGTPTTTNSKVQAGTTSPSTFPASFSTNLTGLTPGTQYTVRAYATNSVGTAYGSSITFTTATPTIALAPASPLPGGTVAAAYSQTLTASGGTAPYSFAITAGALPAGLTLTSAGVLSGTPTAGGTFSFTVRATDAAPSPGPFSGTQAYALTIAAPTITVAPASLPNGATGTAYSQALSASGGTAPYSYAITAGALPAGLTLSSAGVLSGTATAGGTFAFTVRATDASTGSGPYSGPRSYSLTITAPNIVVAPSALPGGTQSTTYSQAITASGGTAPYTYAITAGALPGGLALSSSGTLAGTPTVSGSFTFTVTATDASTGGGPYNGTRSYTLVLGAQAVVATSQSVTVQLDASGNGTLSASSVNNGSTGAGTLTYTIQKIARGLIAEGTTPLTLTTPNGANFTAIRFASYGTPTDAGNGTYRLGSCNAANSVAAAQNAYVGRSTGGMYASSTDTRNNPVLGDPCGGTPKLLAVQAAYSADAASLPYTCAEASKTQYVILTVTDGSGSTSTSVATVTVSAPPTATISSVSPTSAQRGATVTVAGTNLSGVSGVTVNGAAATVSNLSATGFTFVVPNTATFGTGSISVATPCAQTLTNTFTVTAPALTATVSTTSASPTSTTPIPFSVSFSQSVGTTFAAADVTVAGGTLNAASFLGSGSGPYTFTVAPTVTGGTVTVSLAANVAQDANNTGNAASNSVSVQYQQSVTAAPVLTSPANGATTTGLPTFAGTALAGSTVTIYLTPNGGTAQSLGTTTATGGSFSLTPATALASSTYSVYATAQSNGAAVSANSNTSTFTVDATAPTVVSINRQSPAANPTNATSLTYRITFSEGVTGVTAGDFTLTATGTATGIASAVVAVSNDVYDVTVSSASGDGTLRLSLNSTGTGIADLAGNALVGGYASGQAYTLDNSAPLAIISTTAANPTSTSPIPFTVTFQEAVTGFAASGISVTNGTITTAITSVGNAYSFSITPTANGAVTVSVLANAAQDAAGNSNPAAGPLSITYTAPVTLTTWTGNVSTDWYTAGNWTAGVPTATVDAIVPVVGTTRYPLVAAGTASVRRLTLDLGATLTQSGGTLQLRGDLTNNGTLTATGGTVATSGTAAQTLGGSSPLAFWSLNIGAGGTSLGTSASFQRVLTLTGNLTTNGQALTLRSSVSNGVATDGLVVNNGGVVVGTATVQRAIDPSLNPGMGYRHYSAPVSNATVADLTTSGFAPVINPAYNTAARPTAEVPFPTVLGYDDSRLNLTNNLDSFDKGFFSPAALSDPLAGGRGYAVNIGASEVADFQGTLNNGSLTVPLTSTRADYPDGGWQLLGNPYPAPLDYSRVAAADRIGLESAIYMYSSTSQYAGRYRVYINGIGNPVLPIGQGFFARVAIGQNTATMNFRNSQRLTTPNGTTFQRLTADLRPLVQLTLQGTNSALADEAYVYFENGASSGFEPEFDAEKLANPTGLNLSTRLASGQRLSIDGQPELGTSQRVVPLAVGVPAAGLYTFSASQLLNLGAVPVYLRDVQLGTVTDLRQQPSYQFTVTNAAAPLTGRFELVFSPQQALATAPAQLVQQVALYPSPATTSAWLELPASLGRQAVAATLLDALGRQVRAFTLPAQGSVAHQLDLQQLATGVYALHLRTSAGVVVKKLVVK